MKKRHLLLLLSLLCCSGLSAQTRYVFGTAPYTDTTGNVWSPLPVGAMSGVQGTNWRASTCSPKLTDPFYKQQYLFSDPIGVADTITIPLAAGSYTVNMYFNDPCVGDPVGFRVFSLAFNGTVIDPSLDIVKEAGGALKPLIKTGSISGPSLVVTIKLLSGANPIFAALEILPTAPVVTSVTYQVTVNGSGFNQTSVVMQGGVACTGTQFVSSSQLTANCPLGTGTITVTNAPAVHFTNLSWTASSSPGVTGYAVLRSQTSGSGYVAIGNTTAASFHDPNVTAGQTYFYVVQAIAPACPASPVCGNSANSNQFSTTIP